MSDFLANLSPLDGRYANKLKSLRELFSEAGLIHNRLSVEAEWLLFLNEQKELRKLFNLNSKQNSLLFEWRDQQDARAAAEVKKIEVQTNHDVKAVEYYMRGHLQRVGASDQVLSFIHFACTSEDINNLAYAKMLKTAREEIILPKMEAIEASLKKFSHKYASVGMISRTHGQAATPTTVGKEFANFAFRLGRKTQSFRNSGILGKLNGAVGNFNAHRVAFPKWDWPRLAKTFVEKKLGLEFNPYTTQIENHDGIVEYFQALQGYQGILLDLVRDLWAYISIGYFTQKMKAGEVGSSTMPHKVNPIDFENAEGNLGLANALGHFFVEKLPISRWQRDLSDSTVLRSLGSSLGYFMLAIDSIQRGFEKIDLNRNIVEQDLNEHIEVLGEAIQTCMRRYGVIDAYERLKKLTRGQKIQLKELHHLIDTCQELPTDVKARLKKLRPNHYLGYAEELAKRI